MRAHAGMADKLDWTSSLQLPSEDLIAEVLDDLHVTGAAKRAHLGRLLLAHARAYSFNRALKSKWANPHDVRAQMQMTAADLEAVLGRLERLPPELKVMISLAYAERAEGQPANWNQLLAGMQLAQSLTQALSTMKPPNKLPNRVLKNAVGGLMLLLEEVTGNRAKARRRGEGREPELVSVEAQVIGKLLRSVTRLDTTTLVNIIDAICQAHRSQPLSTYSHQLFLGGTITPH